MLGIMADLVIMLAKGHFEFSLPVKRVHLKLSFDTKIMSMRLICIFQKLG